MQVVGVNQVAALVEAKSGSNVEAAPGFPEALAAALSDVSQPAPTRDELLRKIAEQYDPRYMSFLERRAMVRQLADHGLISQAAASVTSFHPSLMLDLRAEGNAGKSPQELVEAAEAQARENKWLNVKQNYLAITQSNVAMNSSNLGREVLDVMWEICQIRDADPELSKHKVPVLTGDKDLAFTVGKGLSEEFALPSGEAASEFELDLTTMALRSIGVSEDEEDEEKALEEARQRAEADAAADAATAAHQARQDAHAEAEESFERNKLEGTEAAKLQAAHAWFEHDPKYV